MPKPLFGGEGSSLAPSALGCCFYIPAGAGRITGNHVSLCQAKSTDFLGTLGSTGAGGSRRSKQKCLISQKTYDGAGLVLLELAQLQVKASQKQAKDFRELANKVK